MELKNRTFGIQLGLDEVIKISAFSRRNTRELADTFSPLSEGTERRWLSTNQELCL